MSLDPTTGLPTAGKGWGYQNPNNKARGGHVSVIEHVLPVHYIGQKDPRSYQSLPHTQVVAILWHQGESDASGGFPVSSWASCLGGLITRWRGMYGATTPFSACPSRQPGTEATRCFDAARFLDLS